MYKFSLCVRGVKTIEQFQAVTKSLDDYDLINYVFERGEYDSEHEEVIFACHEEQEWRRGDQEMIWISRMHKFATFELTFADYPNVFKRYYYHDGMKEVCDGSVVFETPSKIEWDSLLKF